MLLPPNLIIPGAPKSATTALCEHFKQHNDIFVPRLKEPRFFLAKTIQNLPSADPLKKHLIASSALTQEAYGDLYKGSAGVKFRCDPSIHYMYYHDTVIPEIKKYIEDPAIIIILRNPVDRAFSNYMFSENVRDHSFEEALKLEKERKENGWNSFWFYVGQGFYYEQVKHYMAAFPKVKVVLMDDFNKNLNAVMHDIFDFLEVQRIDIDTTKSIQNKSGVPINKFVDWLVYKENFVKTIPRFIFRKMFDEAARGKFRMYLGDKLLKRGNITMSVQTYNDLIDVYSGDILRLQDLIQQDLTAWLKKK